MRIQLFSKEHYLDFLDKLKQSIANFPLKDKLRPYGKYGLEEKNLLNNIQLDIFYYSKNEQGQMLVKELQMYSSGFSTFPYQELEWNVPTDYCQRLIDIYGEDYKTPDPNWYTPDVALNAQIIDKKIIHA